MNRNVGASFGLSVLTVLTFAVALYQPDSPAKPVSTTGPVVVPSVEIVEAREPSNPPPTAPVRVTVTAAPPRTAPIRSMNPTTPTPSRVERLVATTRPVSRREVEPDPVNEPRGAFTKVRRGESLKDIARRVYGSDEAADALWKSNRDLLDRPDAILGEGALLRTP